MGFMWRKITDARRPCTGSEGAESRMNTGREALLVGDAEEELRELLALVVGERREQGVLVFAGDLAHLAEGAPTFVGEPQGVAAAIVGIFAACDQLALFQLV